MNVKDLHLTPDQWVNLLTFYGVPADSLDGKGRPCPACGGSDRFTYDNKNDRGDWVCRGCGTKGRAGAGDGFQLLCNVLKISFRELVLRLEREYFGSGQSTQPTPARSAAAPAPKKKRDSAYVEHRLNTMWQNGKPLSLGDHGMNYLQARVPGLTAPPSPALRIGMVKYSEEVAHGEYKSHGSFPCIVQRFVLPDGRLGTLHRTYLDHVKPAKARIISSDGEILDPKKNDLTLNKLNGGAVRLMDPVNGEIGVAEGLETAYAAHMQFGVPVWNCVNRILLTDFVVPEGLGIRVVHIFADFDEVDPKTKRSPGMYAALELAKRLRADGYTVEIHRPKVRGTDFADEWFAKASVPADAARVAVQPKAVKPVALNA